MRLKSCSVRNFGSYKNLDFSYENLGLSLVYGPTGSGKSTLQDIAPWILYGTTAKNGAVDEVRNWKSQDKTMGTIVVELDDRTLTITRIRGSASQNDLYWEDSTLPGEKKRGKDVSDTQELLSDALGVSADLYCTATYFNEFSDAGSFFVAKAKDRRQVFEKIASLDLPVLLAEKSVLKKKQQKKEIEELRKEKAKIIGRMEQLVETRANIDKHMARWEAAQISIIEELQNKAKFFEKEKESRIDALSTKSYRFEADKHNKVEELVDKLDDLDQKIKRNPDFDKRLDEERRRMLIVNPQCPTCKRPIKDSKELDKIEKEKKQNQDYLDRFAELSKKVQEIQATKNPYKDLIEEAKVAENHYHVQIESQKKLKNPHVGQFDEVNAQIAMTVTKQTELDAKLSLLEYRYNALDRLYDLSFVLRSALLKRVVTQIQDDVNSSLSKYFDGEFRVSFELKDGDDLEVEIYKNGYNCVYTQLSKGQKQLLKLSFCVAVMKAASNNSGAYFNVLSFDEALDGLDSSLKIKAFGMFQELEKSHESILIIDHNPEFQNMFDHKYSVSMVNDESIIENES